MIYKNKGITLVALVITIIILLILAGIAINSLIGSGLFENAKLAKEKSENAQKSENAILEEYENELQKNIYGSRNDIGYNKELNFENKIDISQYKSNQNYFTVENSGIVIMKINPNSWGCIYLVDKETGITGDLNLYYEGCSTGATSVNPITVYKGMKIYLVGGSIGSAIYIPFKN